MVIKLPAIKGIIGDWVYYQTVIPFSEVADRIDNGYSKTTSEYAIISTKDLETDLGDILQRELSKRSMKIKEYLLREESRFFNSAIIGLFGGSPNWYTFEFAKSRVPSMELEDHLLRTIGILELTGEETLFSIDGQHRIDGIKQAVASNSDEFKHDELPIIIIAHTDTPSGKKRTRKLFSEINIKAVKVTGLDNLITNEEDPKFINARRLYKEYKPFKREKYILRSHKENIDAGAPQFTTILNLSTVNQIVTQKIYKHNDYKPSDTEIERHFNICKRFWDEVLKNIVAYQEVIITERKTVADYRSKESGGSLLFRPVGIKLLADSYVAWQESKKPMANFWKKINKVDFSLNSETWSKIAWDPVKNTMKVKEYSFLKEYLRYLIGLNCDENYVLTQYNIFVHDIPESNPNKKPLPGRIK